MASTRAARKLLQERVHSKGRETEGEGKHHKRESPIVVNKDLIGSSGAAPAFEIIVLGSGGGPLESDCSGFLVKRLADKWEDGYLALEAGTGLGTLTSLLSARPVDSMFPYINFPPEYSTPLLQASYIFSHLTAYLISHAHLDHVQSLILQSGSIPPRPAHPTTPNTLTDSVPNPLRSCPAVYGTPTTLKKLATAFEGRVWPELAGWGLGVSYQQVKKRKLASSHGDAQDEQVPINPTVSETTEEERLPLGERSHSCVALTPVRLDGDFERLRDLNLTVNTFSIIHGCNSSSWGPYHSSAFFVQSRTYSQASTDTGGSAGDNQDNKVFLFFGDAESDYRAEGEEDVDKERNGEIRDKLDKVWETAVDVWERDQLNGIFIECSYDSSRSAKMMFGHLSPPALYYELAIFANMVSAPSLNKKPLEGLKVFITHIKPSLIPHPEGKTQRELIMTELAALEEEGGLGVVFVYPEPGDRIIL